MMDSSWTLTPPPNSFKRQPFGTESINFKKIGTPNKKFPIFSALNLMIVFLLVDKLLKAILTLSALWSLPQIIQLLIKSRRFFGKQMLGPRHSNGRRKTLRRVRLWRAKFLSLTTSPRDTLKARRRKRSLLSLLGKLTFLYSIWLKENKISIWFPQDVMRQVFQKISLKIPRKWEILEAT